ncbi:sodium-dependent phosphate transport protein, partial [Kipferlia bialata]
SVGVIMGANIGTTITAQIVAFKVTEYAPILIFLSLSLSVSLPLSLAPNSRSLSH